MPSRIQRVAALPRGRSGKVVLEQVRALLAQAPSARAEANGPSADDSERLLKLAASCFKTSVDTITLASRPRDVPGWDSLAHLELVCALEKEFDLRLSSRDIMSLDRLDKALGLIQKT
ncbi:MAG: acyl carrier protein [Nevskia sp.]|nr:acyl carrier protein [Nevskia sp.]